MSFFKRPLFVVGFILVVAAAGGWYFFVFRGKDAAPAAVPVARGTVIEEVSVTGTVVPAEEVALSFEKSGRIAQISAQVGSRVRAGQVLVSLDGEAIRAQLRQDEAARDAAQAKLSLLQKGTRMEEIAVKRAELLGAEQNLLNDYAAAADAIVSRYADVLDAVRNKTDALFTDDETTNPSLTFQLSDAQLETDLRQLRGHAGGAVRAWREDLDAIASLSGPGVDAFVRRAKERLLTVRMFLNTGLSVMAKTVTLPAATADIYKANLTTALQNVNAAQADVGAREQSILARAATKEKVKKELDLLLAGETRESIENQQAQVAQTEAKIAATRAELDKIHLRSPLNGVVAKQDFKVGEIAPANAALLSIISDAAPEIEANIPEVDIRSVTVGAPARVTLDAFGSDLVFDAVVIAVDPAETVVEGVATYRTTLRFQGDASRVRSGMTANIDIRTKKRENVFVIPVRVIRSRNGEKFVRVITGRESTEERMVKTGIKGLDGNVEITEGLREGERVIAP